MALPLESIGMSDQRRSLETWIWPVMAAIIIGGSLVFWSLAAMLWLATHPARESTVIWMQPAASQAANEDQPATAPASARLENRSDARTN